MGVGICPVENGERVECELDSGFGYREHERVDKRFHLVFKTGQDIGRFYRADEGFVQVNLVYGTSSDRLL